MNATKLNKPENAPTQLPPTAVPAAVALPLLASKLPMYFGIVLISGLDQVQSHHKLDLLYFTCNGAICSCVSIIRARAVTCARLPRAHYSCTQMPSSSEIMMPVGVRLIEKLKCWQLLRVCPADSSGGRTVRLSNLALNLTA